MKPSSEWHIEKNQANQRSHGVSFEEAQYAFLDANRLIVHDEKHSVDEQRWFCIGRVGERVLTVRFTYRDGRIRIFGVGIWRKWRRYYERENGPR